MIEDGKTQVESKELKKHLYRLDELLEHKSLTGTDQKSI